MLTMTNNMTVFAHQSFYDITWSSSAGVDWEVATNWSPSFVPGRNDNVFITQNVMVALNSPTECASLTLGTETSGPNLAGSGTLTLRKDSFWNSGGMTGGGLTIVSPGVTLVLSNAFALILGRTLENRGTIVWTGAAINMAAGVLTNCPGALFLARNNASFNLFGAPNRFDNAGTFRKTSSGNTFLSAGVPFNNYGFADLRSGILVANGGYTSSSGALLNCSLAGVNAGSGYGQLQSAGAVSLNGALSVDLVNGFSPATNDLFNVVSAGARNGSFSGFAFPSNQVTMELSNSATSVIVRTIAVAVQRPLLLSPALSGSNVILFWRALSNITYRVDFNSDLNPSNWNALPGDVTSRSNTASKLDTLTPSNRFYRVRVLP
jgi:hypothetical protein